LTPKRKKLVIETRTRASVETKMNHDLYPIAHPPFFRFETFFKEAKFHFQVSVRIALRPLANIVTE